MVINLFEDLIVFDGPVLVRAGDEHNQYMLYSIPSPDDYWYFLVWEVALSDMELFLLGGVDVVDIFDKRVKEKLWMTEIIGKDDPATVTLEPAEDIPAEWLPKRGFSFIHT